MIIRKEKNKNYSIISNECLKNPKISTRAKGMYAYIMTLPDDWTIQRGELYKHFVEGKDYLDKGFNELKKYGYIQQTRVHKENGQFVGWEYVVYEFAQDTRDETISGNSDFGAKPQADLPISDLPTSDLPTTAKPQLLNTETELNTEKELNTKRKLNTDKLKNINDDDDQNKEVNQSVSPSSPFFLQVDKSARPKKIDEIKEGLNYIGLSKSQITVLLRGHDISIIEDAIGETYQAQYEKKITKSSAQYFYGILKNMIKNKQIQPGDN